MSKYFNFKFKYSLFPLHRPSISTSLPTGLLCFHFSSHLFSPLVSLYKPIANCHFIRTFPFSHSLVQFHSFNSFCSSSSFVTIQCIYSTKYNSHFIYYNPSTRSPLVSSLTKLGILLTSSFYFDLRSPPTAPHTSYFNRKPQNCSLRMRNSRQFEFDIASNINKLVLRFFRVSPTKLTENRFSFTKIFVCEKKA